MDDFNLTSLKESRNEYSSLLLKYLTPPIYHGFESMFNDIVQLCDENDEEEKYLMTFQNFLTRVPKWNNEMINTEVQRILDDSKCTYLSDLLTCVHVTQLKILTNVRVGKTNKKIDIDIPSLDIFIHQVYIECARKLYKRIYLYEIEIEPIVKQKYIREIEIVIMDSIMDAIRLNMPIESILKAYLDESSENDVYDKVEEIKVPFEETSLIYNKNTESEINSTKIEPMSLDTTTEISELENNLKLSLHDDLHKTSITNFNDNPVSELPLSTPLSLNHENTQEDNTNVPSLSSLSSSIPSTSDITSDITIDTNTTSNNLLNELKPVPVSPKFIGDIGDGIISDTNDGDIEDDVDYSDNDSRIRIFDENENENIQLDFDEL